VDQTVRVRKPIKLSLRFAVFERDRFRCHYCGRSTNDGAVLHVDHITPWSKGGSDDLANLLAACSDCNRGKSDTVVWAKRRPTPVEPDDFPVGSYCSTPLFVAATGQLLGLSSYQAAHRSASRFAPKERMPPLRARDARLSDTVDDELLRIIVSRVDAILFPA